MDVAAYLIFQALVPSISVNDYLIRPTDPFQLDPQLLSSKNLFSLFFYKTFSHPGIDLNLIIFWKASNIENKFSSNRVDGHN